MFGLPPKIIVFDTEYTSWEGAQERRWSGPNEYREIVQIGAVRVRTNTFQELDSFSAFVRPVRNPKLSDFLINLTGISQEIIDSKGSDFSSAIAKFLKWTAREELYAFGHDGNVLEENAKLLGVGFPFKMSRFHDIKELFTAHGIPADDYMSSTIVRAFGREPKRSGHDGLNDARTIVDGLILLAERNQEKER